MWQFLVILAILVAGVGILTVYAQRSRKKAAPEPKKQPQHRKHHKKPLKRAH